MVPRCSGKGISSSAYLSTQNVSQTDDGFAGGLEITADDVDVHCDYMGGGFGSKFKPDYWGIAAAQISKATGRPVKFLLTRDQELKIGGNRPSGFIKVKLGADENGVVQVWDSHHWGTSGYDGSTVSVGNFPYVFQPKNFQRKATGIITNNEPSVAWRAPNHPQACALTQTAFDDLAAKMQADSLDIFLRNLETHRYAGKGACVRRAIADRCRPDRLARTLASARQRAASRQASSKAWGLAIHKWGGGANSSNCLLKIHPDGGVESYCGTQDLGTGTRTVCAMVLAETFGLPIEAVKVNIGSSTYPFSGASGGSTTVGAVSESHRRAAQDALAQIFELVATKLGRSGRPTRSRRRPDFSRRLQRPKPVVERGLQPDRHPSAGESRRAINEARRVHLSSSNVAGIQMAHVAVDTDTGVVKIKKMVAVQDIGLIINRKTAESQVYGAMIMSIAASLFEQRINDPQDGRFHEQRAGQLSTATPR